MLAFYLIYFILLLSLRWLFSNERKEWNGSRYERRWDRTGRRRKRAYHKQDILLKKTTFDKKKNIKNMVSFICSASILNKNRFYLWYVCKIRFDV